MSRTRRFVDAVWLGYSSQALVMLVGLWLTPFLLRHIGQHDYGLWIVGLQILMYLSLLDLGVVALVPRDTAYATGRAGTIDKAEDLPLIIARTGCIILYQMPFVILALLMIWFFMPEDWGAFHGPVTLALAAFAVTFPFRIFQAVLQGLQDMRFLGAMQILTWAISTVTMILLVLSGYGLYALAIGWACTQIGLAAVMFWRLKSCFPFVLPSRIVKVPLRNVGHYFSRGFWVSITQVAGPLIAGADILVISKVLGPMAVVPYMCTGKLVSVLTNQPNLLMQAAAPGLSELRGAGSHDRILKAISALGQGVLLLSGAVACVVLAVNKVFVTWWVGQDQYSGTLLTGVFVVNMLLRHWNTTAIYSVFCLGYERRQAVTYLMDAIVTATAIVVLVRELGPIGGPLGSIAGVCLVSLPANVSFLCRELNVSWSVFLKPLWPWFWRFVPLAMLAVATAEIWKLSSFVHVALISAIISGIYLVVMYHPGKESLLATYFRFQSLPQWSKVISARPVTD